MLFCCGTCVVGLRSGCAVLVPYGSSDSKTSTEAVNNGMMLRCLCSSLVYLDGETAVAATASLVHIGAGHLPDRPSLLDKRQHVFLIVHHQLAQPESEDFTFPGARRRGKGHP